MRTMGDVIRSLRQENYLTQQELAEELCVAKSTIGMWENNVREPNKEAREAICDYFNVDMNYLFGKTYIRNNYRDGDEIVQVPLFQKLNSMQQLHDNLHSMGLLTVPTLLLTKDSNYFAVIASDSSMAGFGINDRDIMIFQGCAQLKAGEILYVSYQEQSICRKAFPDGSQWTLKASNDSYPDISISTEDEKFHCLGILIAVVRRYPH